MVAVLALIAAFVVAVLLGWLLTRLFDLGIDDFVFELAGMTGLANVTGLGKSFGVFGLALLIGIGAYFGMVQLGKYIPVTDDARFNSRLTAAGTGTDTTTWKEIVCRRFQEQCHEETREITSSVPIKLRYPRSVAQGQDFNVLFEFEKPKRRPEDKRPFSAILLPPSYLEARSVQSCPDQSAARGVAVCQQGDGKMHTVQFEWSVTPTKTGSAILSLTSSLLNEARLSPPQQLVSPELRLSGGTAKFKIDVLTTLGVSQWFYDVIVVLGGGISALGTLLGAGFALLFFKGKDSESDAKDGSSNASEVQQRPAPSQQKTDETEDDSG